jgi:nicotinamidase-related amidase
VYQTVRDLVAAGQQVHVPRDVVSSRTQENWQAGLSLIERLGGVVTTAETVVFDALGQAGTEAFKALSRLLK